VATNIGELVWKITGDTRDIDKSLKSTDTQLKRFGDTLKTAFSIGAIVAAGKAIFDVGKRLTGLAGDLAESRNAVDVVFGDASDTIQEFAEGAVLNVGLTQTAFNELATGLGALLKQSGLAIDDVADSTIELSQRAADTASIFNVEVSDALGAFNAALRGEAEPARRFGVNISDAAVQAEALASGLVETKNEITDQIKVQARYNLILQQTSDFTGDFANTQGSFNNQVKIAKANIEELSASIGEDLLPAATNALTVINEFLNRLQEGRALGDAFERQREGLQTVADEILIIEARIRRGGLTNRQLEEQEAELARLRDIQERAEANRAIFEDNQRFREANAAAEAEAAEETTEVILEEEEVRSSERKVNEKELLELAIAAEAAKREARKEAARRAIEEEEALTESIRAETLKRLGFASGYASNVGQIFSNLIAAVTAGDKELTERQKQSILTLYRFQQAASIAQVGIDTASAIVRQFRDLPFPAALVTSAIIGGIGATQIGVIAATPPPALQDGGIVPAQPGGRIVQVAEGGRDEAIVPLDDAGGFGTLRVVVNLNEQPIIDTVQSASNRRELIIDAGSIS
jgi:hypothetical protein